MKIVLIGHTVGVRYCIRACESGPHKVTAIFTHQRELHEPDLELFRKRGDLYGDLAYDVFDATADVGIPVLEYHDLKAQSEVDRILAFEPDVVVTVGCRDILSAAFIDAFPFVINLHPFYLPVYRGAGIDSWMILTGATGTEQYATAHFVRPRLDAGEIITTLPYRIPENAMPIDIFRVRISLLGELLIRALKLLQDPAFKGTLQEESGSRYFPRLNTMRDGHIQVLNWSGDEIIIFIRAFSYPYPGAWLMLGEQKVHILIGAFVPEEHVHPFAFGLIYRKSADGFSFYVKGGSIHVTSFETSSPDVRIKLGQFLR